MRTLLCIWLLCGVLTYFANCFPKHHHQHHNRTVSSTDSTRNAIIPTPPSPTKEINNRTSRSEIACQRFRGFQARQKRKARVIVFNVFGGEETTQAEFPYMVALGAVLGKGTADSNLIWICGGSLISERYVLSAAHCITDAQDDNMRPVALRLGKTRLQQGPRSPEDYAVESVKLHPQHDKRYNYNDLALLRTDRSVTLSNTVRPVCLPSQKSARLNTNMQLLAVGWGATDTAGFARSEVLKKAELRMVPLDDCKQSFTNSTMLPRGLDKSMICAADPKGKSDTCLGDSGGPLVMREGKEDTLVGVTSFGGRFCGGKKPGVYASTAQELKWIENIVWP